MEEALFYCVLIFIVTSLAYLSNYLKRDIKFCILSIILFISSGVIACFFSAIRYNIGTDYKMYTQVFDYTGILTIDESIKWFEMEYGWIILNKLLYLIFENSQSIFVVTSIIITSAIYFYIYKYRNKINIGLAVFIFMTIMYIPSFNVVRQYVAISIGLIAYESIIKGSKIKFLIAIVLASLFHNTVLFLLPLYFYHNIPVKLIQKRIILIIITLGVLIFYDKVLYLISNINPIFSKFIRYSSNGSFEFRIGDLIFISAICIFIFSYYKFTITKNKEFELFFDIVIIYSIFILCSFFTDYAIRFTYWYQIGLIVLPSYIAENQKNRFNKLTINILLLLYFSTYFFYYYVSKGQHQAVPYISIFS